MQRPAAVAKGIHLKAAPARAESLFDIRRAARSMLQPLNPGPLQRAPLLPDIQRHRSSRRSRAIRYFVVFVTLVLPFSCYVFCLVWITLLGPNKVFLNNHLATRKNILWVVAHPDDETLFFAPSILQLFNYEGKDHPDNRHAFVLSLSAGNSEGYGDHRKREMKKACWTLGIPSDRCIIIDDEQHLPDDANVWWEEKVIEDWVRAYVDKWKIDAIITFDDEGISGHANHRAISAAMSRAVHVDNLFPLVWQLKTPPLWSKYLSILTIPQALFHQLGSYRSHLSALPSKDDASKWEVMDKASKIGEAYDALYRHESLLISSPIGFWKAKWAFSHHHTQNLWFRKLFTLFSRTMWINELERVVSVQDRVKMGIGKSPDEL